MFESTAINRKDSPFLSEMAAKMAHEFCHWTKLLFGVVSMVVSQKEVGLQVFR